MMQTDQQDILSKLENVAFGWLLFQGVIRYSIVSHLKKVTDAKDDKKYDERVERVVIKAEMKAQRRRRKKRR